MRTWQPMVARLAIGGGLVWCAPSQSVRTPTAGTTAVMVRSVEAESHATRAPGVLPPNPLVSRSKRVVGWSSLQFPQLPNVNDGDYSTAWGAGRPTPDQPAWVAIDVGAGPRRLLVNWSARGSYNYEETDYGSPGAYRIETSGDSTDGVNGTWRTVADVPHVSTHGQAHSFDFDGQRWVKLVVTGTPAQSPNGVQISEMDVHDVSAGMEDSWFFVGDSITALAFNRTPAHQPSFAAWVNQRSGDYFPAMIDGGNGGDKSDEGAARIDEWLVGNPDVHFWAIAFGTNDAAGNASDTTRFRAQRPDHRQQCPRSRSRPDPGDHPVRIGRTAPEHRELQPRARGNRSCKRSRSGPGPVCVVRLPSRRAARRRAPERPRRRLDQPPLGRGSRGALPALSRSGMRARATRLEWVVAFACHGAPWSRASIFPLPAEPPSS